MCRPEYRYGGGKVAAIAEEDDPVAVIEQPAEKNIEQKPVNNIVNEQEAERLIRLLKTGNVSKIKAGAVIESIRAKIASVDTENKTDKFAVSHAESVVTGIEDEDPLTPESIKTAVGVVQWLVEKGLE